MKKIPIKTAKQIAEDWGYDQVLIFGWDKKTCVTSVATYGRTTEDCDQIAQGGNWLKKTVLGWPESECCAEPSRVKKLRKKIKEFEEQVQKMTEMKVQEKRFKQSLSEGKDGEK